MAAERGDELVAGAWLWDGHTALVEPGLEVRVRPRVVEPVAGVGGSLASLLRDFVVVGARSGEKRVASARVGVGNVVLVEKGLELRLGPAVIC